MLSIWERSTLTCIMIYLLALVADYHMMKLAHNPEVVTNTTHFYLANITK